jgi:anti-sigma factor RsiW
MLSDRISRLLTAYVDGELTARQCKVVARLLDRSSEARELLRALQNDAEQLRSAPRQTLGPDFAQRVLQTIVSRKTQAGRRPALRVPMYVPIGFSLATAAAVLLLIGFGAYVYIAAVDRQRLAEIALRSTPSTLQPVEQSAIDPAAIVSPAPEPELRERLGTPALANEAKAAAPIAVPSIKEDKLSTGTRGSLRASPLRPESRLLKVPDGPVALTFNLRELDQTTLKQQLQKGAAHRLDLRCADTLTGVQRLHSAFESRGVRCIIDQDARAFLKLGMGKNPPLALFFEAIATNEMVAVLQQLGSEDRKPAVGRRGKSVFDILMVHAMSREDQQKVPWELGIESALLDEPMPKEQVLPDSRKPSTATAHEGVADRPTGQGGPQTEAGPPVVENLDRQVLVVEYTPGRPRQTSVELKRFLDGRRERRAGTVLILLVLTPTN